MNWLSMPTLQGQFVTLEPLRHSDLTALQNAVTDGESWKWWYANVPTPQDMENYIDEALDSLKLGNIVYVVRSRLSGEIVGTTRFYNVDSSNRRAMLGYTWYSAAVRRTPINTECKLLLLNHIFKTHGAMAVEFRTHFFNQTSRRAIERLGAKQDGIIRNHQISRDGSIRDTVMYSIIESEWPAVKKNLSEKLKNMS